MKPMPIGVVVVGERFNQGSWAPRDASLETDPRFLLRLGAFKRGLGRKRLEELGLRWDAAMNLLMPSPVIGEWDAEKADRVAGACWPYLEQTYRVIVMCGRRVARAFKRDGDIPSLEAQGRVLLLPHPSGRSRAWNDGKTVVMCRRLVRVAQVWLEPMTPRIVSL